ncbi:MAG: thioredoxin domain-containing protein [Myxococcaceae bacterium]|nr:thioredoxin domain-containing protein [Myxococcaceae bacterium]
MSSSSSRLLSACVAAGFAFACACTQSPKPSAGGATESPDQVVATWSGGKSITLKEVDAKLGEQLEEIEKQKFQLRRQGIEREVIESLLKAEAAKAGKNEDEWLRAQVEPKITEPSEDELAKFFAENQSQMPPGATLETMHEQLKGYLKQQQQRKIASEIVDGLKAAANVKITFKEPPKPRKTVEAKGPSRGPADAKVTIVEFSDFQCPFCSRVHDTVEKVMETYPGKVKLVFRQFPLSFHDKAPKAAEAALCAHEQGQFWKYHDVLFKNQSKLAPDDLKAHAKELGLDEAKFASCLESGKSKSVIDEDMAAGSKVGVTGTPAFFINGIMLSGAQPFEQFKEVIDDELAAK